MIAPTPNAKEVCSGVVLRFAFLLPFLLTAFSAASPQAALQAPPKSAAPLPPLPALAHPTLDRIRAQQDLTCGVSKEEEDFSRSTDHGNRAAFDIDLCKAVAIAVLGPGAHLVIKSFPDEPAALRALRSAQVDMVATASLTVRNMADDVAFSAPVLLDSQALLTTKTSGAHSASDLAGKRVCFLTGSAAEQGLHSYATTHGLTYVWYPFSEAGEMEAAFFTGNCDAITSDLTSLANIRAIDPRRSAEFTIVPTAIREDPLAVAVWAGDSRFAAVVYWTVQSLFSAEQLGITRANAAAMTDSPQPEVRELMGQAFGTGTLLGLDPHWGAAVLSALGNYGEIFERDLGSGSPLRLDRGQNRFANAGGAFTPIPVSDR
jgi:general L-amino acid transport system substrate-binding protein